MPNAKEICEQILKSADIEINGKRDWDIKINNPEVYERILAKASLGLGESYMDFWWDCKKIDEFIFRILTAKLDKINKTSLVLNVLKSKLTNFQSKSRAFEVGKHYDTGNDLFQLMLDKRMNYTCGFWKNAKNLDQAQENKLELTCKKLKLRPGMKILDIGCGWGSFLKYAAEKYKIKGVGITISKEQAELAKENCKNLDIEIRLIDYRDLDLNEKFDRIVSIGMFEHVGSKNYKKYMRIASKILKNDGIFLLHTIGTKSPNGGTDPWLNKYIFPNGQLPSSSQILNSAKGIFILQDWQNLPMDYYKTLHAWNDNFQKNWPKLKDKYSDRFKRMWEYYLMSCAGAFKSGNIQLWQIVFTKHGMPFDYVSVR